MFDDLSPRIGAFGDTLARTPNLDRLAGEGIRYPNTFVTGPVCAPSRAALFSGRHQQTITAQHMRTSGVPGLPGGGPIEYLAVPPPQVKWLPELMRRAGYFTINVGKTDYQIGDPFTIWDVNARDADWRKRPKDRPFFAFINLSRTHESYIWPEDLKSSNPLVQRVVQRNRQDLQGKPRLTDPAKVRVPAFLPDTPVVRADIARLYDNLAFDEREVGRIMQALKEDGVLENTVVIATSDHGDGLPRMKRAIYDAGLRVPLIVRLPDRSRPASSVGSSSPSSISRRPSSASRACRFRNGCKAGPSSGRRPWRPIAMSTREPTASTRFRSGSGACTTAATNIFGTSVPICPSCARSLSGTSCRRCRSCGAFIGPGSSRPGSSSTSLPPASPRSCTISEATPTRCGTSRRTRRKGPCWSAFAAPIPGGRSGWAMTAADRNCR
jgi:hypothetical protein